jgi:MFS transporter, Spinster family, sphingosine-1-phosphate transporter
VKLTPRDLSPAWTLAILTGLNLFNYLDRAVLAAVLTPLRNELGLSFADAGFASTAFMLGYFVTSPVFGILGDRLSRKWLIAAGIFVWSLGTVLTGMAWSFAALIAYRVLVGVGEASYATISPSILADKFSGTARNTALTVFYVAIPVGSALGYGIGGAVADAFSWRQAFIWAGAPGLLLALVLLPFADPPRTSAKPGAKPGWRDVVGLLKRAEYVTVVLGYTAYTFALGAFQHWGPTFLQEQHGMPLGKATLFFGAALVLTGLSGTFIGGMLASGWQKRTNAGYAWLCGWSVLVAVPLAAGAFLAREAQVSMAFLAGAMFFLFLSTGPVNTLILETAPAHLRASAMAVSIFTIHLFGDLWSPSIVGKIADARSLTAGVLILPIALAVAAVLWLLLGWRMRRSDSPAAA